MLLAPLDRATHARGLLQRPASSLDYLRHRVVKLAPSARQGAGASGVEAAAILQFVLGVEAEEVGGALRAISARDGLRLVDHVGKGETMLLGESLHVVE